MTIMTYLVGGAFALGNLYLIWQLNYWMGRASDGHSESWARKLLLIFIVLCMASTPFLGALLPESAFQFLLQGIGNVWLSVALCMIVVLVAAQIIKWITKKNGKKTAVAVLILTFGLTAGFNGYGAWNAQQIRTTSYDCTVEKEAKLADGTPLKKLKVTVISDIHIDSNSSRAEVRRMVEAVNASEADVVLFAGDMITSSFEQLRHKDEYAQILSGMKGKYGVYGAYGNHDVEEPLLLGFSLANETPGRTPEIAQFMVDSGLTMLSDESTVIPGTNVQLIGRLSHDKVGVLQTRKNARQLTAGLDKDAPIIMIQHEPGEYDESAANGIDLVVSGHTHNGQIFPGTIIAARLSPLVYGTLQKDGMTAVTSSGAGFYGPPLRVGTISEITVMNITFQ